MHAFERFSAGATVALVVCGGCAPTEHRDDRPTVAEAAAAETVANGLHLNGLHLNGIHANGIYLNGLHLNGLYLNGLHVNGAALTGAALGGMRADGRPLAGTDLAGAELHATASDGTPVTLRIDMVTRAQQPDVLLYAVSYRAADGLSQPLCGVDDGAPVKALALAGTWDESEGTPTGGAHVDDPDLFTFACQGYAIAKCVELGYAPWRTATECRAPGECHDLPLAPLHQACTRMLRADYCGDGTATTRDGTLVDVWDVVSIQSDDAPNWTFEAEWTPRGASCVMATRWPTIVDQSAAVAAYIQHHCPAGWLEPGCGRAGSTFFAANGFDLPASERSLLRTRIDRGPN